MKASQNPRSVRTTQRKLLNWVVALGVAGGVLLPSTGLAASAEGTAEVPFVQALADAHQVANLDSGWKVYVSRGDSMFPQIGHNSLLLVARTEFDKLIPGMLVVYRDRTGDLVSHRLIAHTSDGWVAKGLNNYREDPGLVTRENLQGVVFGTMTYQAGTEDLAARDAVHQPAVAYAKKY